MYFLPTIAENHSDFLPYHFCNYPTIRNPSSLLYLLIWSIPLYAVSFPSSPTSLCGCHPHSTQPWKPCTSLTQSPCPMWTPSWALTPHAGLFRCVIFLFILLALIPHARLFLGLMYAFLVLFRFGCPELNLLPIWYNIFN